MDKQALKDHAKLALETLKESAVQSGKNFLPLLAGWFVALCIPVFLVGMGLLMGTLSDRLIGHSRTAGYGTLLGWVVPGTLLAWLFPGLINISLKVARKLPVRRQDIFLPFGQTFSAAVALVITVSVAGLLSTPFTLVIPGAFLFLKWQLAPYYAVDKGMGPIESMKQSWADTGGNNFIPLALLDLCFVGIGAAVSFTGFGLILNDMVWRVASGMVYAKWTDIGRARTEIVIANQ